MHTVKWTLAIPLPRDTAGWTLAIAAATLFVAIVATIVPLFIAKRERRGQRVARVVTAYVLRGVAGPNGLIRAGVRELKSSDEILEAVDAITLREGDPLNPNAAQLRKADLKAFFAAYPDGGCSAEQYKEALRAAKAPKDWIAGLPD